MGILDVMIMDQDTTNNATEVVVYYRLFYRNYSHTMWVSNNTLALLNKLCK